MKTNSLGDPTSESTPIPSKVSQSPFSTPIHIIFVSSESQKSNSLVLDPFGVLAVIGKLGFPEPNRISLSAPTPSRDGPSARSGFPYEWVSPAVTSTWSTLTRPPWTLPAADEVIQPNALQTEDLSCNTVSLLIRNSIYLLYNRGECMLSVFSRSISGFLVACLVLVLDGPAGHAQGAWEFGAQTLLVTADSAAPLTQPAFGSAGLVSADILASVGGVDLEGVAVIDPAPNDLAITYHPENPDGQRLQITVWGATYAISLPDWELKPIALLADSPYSADISLFGNGPDPDHFYYIQYHPALKNTLLGLRLLQADMQLMDPQDMTAPPKFNGQIILGLGEQLPSAANAAQAVNLLTEIMAVEPIQSWILTDINTQITLQKSGTEGLDLAASPYYYFWTTPYERLDDRKRMLEALLSGETDPGKAAKMKAELTTIESQLADFNSSNQRNDPQPVTEVTDALKSHPEVLNALNPLVWNAVMDTAEFGALFRYYKAHDTTGWNSFLSSLQGVTPSPEIATPTQWARQ